MTSFIDLPSELQYLIFRDLSAKDHRSLALTHSALRCEAQGQLFRSISLPVQSRIVDTDHPGDLVNVRRLPEGFNLDTFAADRRLLGSDLSGEYPIELPADKKRLSCYRRVDLQSTLHDNRRIKQFLGAINSNPELSKYVRHIHITALWGALTVFHTRAFEIVGRLPRVCKVSLSMFEMIRGSCWHDVKPLCLQWLCKLIEQTGVGSIHFGASCHQVVGKVMQMPTTETIECTGRYHRMKPRYDDKTIDDILNWVDEVPLPNLTKVCLGQLQLSQKDLHRICTRATALVHLSAGFSQTLCNLNVASACLSRARDRLQVLEFVEPYDDILPLGFEHSEVKGQIDFSQFVSLKKLKISSVIWYNDSCRIPGAQKEGFVHACETRQGAPALLPPSIEEVELIFASESSVFAIGPTHRKQFLEQSHKAEHYSWILDFIQPPHGTTRNHLGNLKALRLVEARMGKNTRCSITGDTFDFYDFVSEKEKAEFKAYRPPPAVRNAFHEAGIELTINLAVPNTW